MSDERRSQAARAAAEQALVRVVHFYGSTPAFVLLGGLVPQLLCSAAAMPHAGTTDIDVQVDLEIASESAGLVVLRLRWLRRASNPRVLVGGGRRRRATGRRPL